VTTKLKNLDRSKIDALIKQNKTIYDMFGDKSSKKFGDNKRKNLEKFDINKLPSYIQNNIEKFKNWID
jgi:beta-1,4-mannosyl-glycoprotein beta-1,4-N-acetylglucosaminyltransferase